MYRNKMVNLSIKLQVFVLTLFIAISGGIYNEDQTVYAQSQEQTEENNYEKASLILNQVTSPSIHSNQNIEERDKLIMQSIDLYTDVINVSGNYTVSAYINRGNAHLELQDYDKAISDYSKALELSPDSIDALKNRGLVYEMKGDHINALTDLQIFLTNITDTPTERRRWERDFIGEKIRNIETKLTDAEKQEVYEQVSQSPKQVPSDYQPKSLEPDKAWQPGSWLGNGTTHNKTNLDTGATIPNLSGFTCELFHPGHKIENAVWFSVPPSTRTMTPFYQVERHWAEMTFHDHYYAINTDWTPYNDNNYFLQITNTEICAGLRRDVSSFYRMAGEYYD